MSTFKEIASKALPFIGAAVSGNVPLLIGMAAKEIGRAMGGEIAPTADAIQAVVLGANPQQLAQIKQAEQDFAYKMRELGYREAVDLERIAVADRDSARTRDTAITQTGGHNWRGDILAALAVGGLVFCVWLVARDASLPERAVNAVMFVAGVLASAVRDVYGFEFGSSKGSKEYGDTVRQIAINK